MSCGKAVTRFILGLIIDMFYLKKVSLKQVILKKVGGTNHNILSESLEQKH